MDDYMSFAVDIITPEYTLISSKELNARVVANTIVIDGDVLSDCPAPHELKENMLKRLVGKTNTVGGPNLCIVATMCLASNDYSVSHSSISGVSEKYMMKIWSYLERQVVSSSYLLRQWMRSRIGTRTCEGYMARWNISRNIGLNVGNNNVEQGSWVRCVDITKDIANKISGQPVTILEAARNDITVSAKVKMLIIR